MRVGGEGAAQVCGGDSPRCTPVERAEGKAQAVLGEEEAALNRGSEELVEGIGRYYTQGMAEDVNSLKNDILSDAEFMQQVDLVYRERVDMLDYALDLYTENDDGGFLFFYFSTVDLCCHMMWRHTDSAHPAHDAEKAKEDSSWWSGREGSTWKDTVADLYMKMDPVIGRVRERLGDETTLIVMSDHGFAPFRYEFSLNTWLYENGYLVLKPGFDKELARDASGFKKQFIFTGAVDWSKTNVLPPSLEIARRAVPGLAPR
jgi:predicted AlkP superfamily phosphohydrolase/phosphomutase